MEGFVSVREGFFDRLENFLHPSEGDLFPAGNRLLRGDVTTAPGALDRTPSPQGEMIDG